MAAHVPWPYAELDKAGGLVGNRGVSRPRADLAKLAWMTQS